MLAKKVASDIVIKETSALFKKAIGNARQTGKIFAIVLSLLYPFNT
jgi:hypothetical protein